MLMFTNHPLHTKPVLASITLALFCWSTHYSDALSVGGDAATLKKGPAFVLFKTIPTHTHTYIAYDAI
jgi:hypothetical protein